MCVHDTDSRGFCTKNGPHCAFAHGNHDLRPPVYDINEQKVLHILNFLVFLITFSIFIRLLKMMMMIM